MFQILHDIGVWQRLNFNWLAALAVHACPCGALSSFSSALSLIRSLTGLNVEQAGEAILSIDVHGLEWAKCALLTHHTSMCRYTYIIGIHWHRYTALHDADSAPSTRSTDSLSTGSAGSKIVSKEIKCSVGAGNQSCAYGKSALCRPAQLTRIVSPCVLFQSQHCLVFDLDESI